MFVLILLFSNVGQFKITAKEVAVNLQFYVQKQFIFFGLSGLPVLL